MGPHMTDRHNLRQKNRRALVIGVATVAGMMGLSFASVPLYQIFCQVTGFDGTTQTATSLPGKIVDRDMVVRFNADTDTGLPWAFEPETRQVTVKLGQGALVAYRAVNRANESVTGQAVYNVTPDAAGYYFHKIQCFCFNQQTLKPHETVDMPVYFYVDPELANDPDLAQVQTITLSYTFYPARKDGKQVLSSDAGRAMVSAPVRVTATN